MKKGFVYLTVCFAVCGVIVIGATGYLLREYGKSTSDADSWGEAAAEEEGWFSEEEKRMKEIRSVVGTDLYPCDIKITQEGTPLAGATVTLQYLTKEMYSTSGVTDEEGVAVMKTFGYDGARQGTAKVCVDKLVKEGSSEAEESCFHLVDKKYRSFDASMLEITISKGSNTFWIEVEAPVHDRVE